MSYSKNLNLNENENVAPIPGLVTPDMSGVAEEYQKENIASIQIVNTRYRNAKGLLDSLGIVFFEESSTLAALNSIVEYYTREAETFN
jgi:hypothetical protein